MNTAWRRVRANRARMLRSIYERPCCPDSWSLRKILVHIARRRDAWARTAGVKHPYVGWYDSHARKAERA